jgi:two-component system, NtrC family, sensor kinase
VKDTGKGIQPEFLSHIFDPFFSTKGEAGTGLGLSVSYGIIKNHRGDIRVESKPGVGTTFTVELPISRDHEEGIHGTEQDHGHRR